MGSTYEQLKYIHGW